MGDSVRQFPVKKLRIWCFRNESGLAIFLAIPRNYLLWRSIAHDEKDCRLVYVLRLRGDADYIIPVAGRAASYGAIGVAMARPGYTLDGRTSSGVATRDQSRSDRFTAYEINSIAAAVATLKKHHGAKRVVMVGHSGGAVVSGVMLGSSAPLVDVVILVSCPCDMPGWRYSHGREPFENAESPIDYLSDAPKSSKIFALTGERDKNTWPEIAQDYVKKARDMGLDATFFMIQKAGHGFRRLGRSAEFKNSLRQAIDLR